jgi:hypothetical protein
MKRRFQRLAVLGVTSITLSVVGATAAPAAPNPTGRGGHANRVLAHHHSTTKARLTAEQLTSQISQWDREGYEPAEMTDVVSRFRSSAVYLRAAELRDGHYVIHELETFPTAVGLQVARKSGGLWTRAVVWVNSETGKFTLPTDQGMGFSVLESDNLRHIHVLRK